MSTSSQSASSQAAAIQSDDRTPRPTSLDRKLCDAAFDAYAHVVLERSGSMHSCASDNVSGYNTYVAKLPETARVGMPVRKSS
jgi:hypothetical protein